MKTNINRNLFKNYDLKAYDLVNESLNKAEKDLDFIRLATPTTDKKRLNIVLNKSSGFLYYVSIMGITGTKEPNLDILKEQISKLRKETDIPIGVGFGIKRPDQAQKISEFRLTTNHVTLQKSKAQFWQKDINILYQ